MISEFIDGLLNFHYLQNALKLLELSEGLLVVLLF